MMEDDSEYQITLTPIGVQHPLNPSDVIRVVAETLRKHGTQRARINVALVTDNQIAELNEKHLAHDGPTDVITFDLREQVEPDEDWEVDGEIVVSVDTAMREAHSRSHQVDAELMLYIVHGALHLLGYDDKTQEDADRMHAEEDLILNGTGWGSIYQDKRS